MYADGSSNSKRYQILLLDCYLLLLALSIIIIRIIVVVIIIIVVAAVFIFAFFKNTYYPLMHIRFTFLYLFLLLFLYLFLFLFVLISLIVCRRAADDQQVEDESRRRAVMGPHPYSGPAASHRV